MGLMLFDGYCVVKNADQLSQPIRFDTHPELFPFRGGHPGCWHSPVLAVENVDVRQSILLDISSDGVHISSLWCSSGSHTFYLHVQHCSCHMAIISTSYMSIPA